jgi:phage tail-like protein
MRGAVHGLPVANPIGERLPAIFAEDDFAQRMTSALDDVLAPVFATLDCFPDYFDPILAPADFVDWLSGWVAFSLDEGWSLAQRRALVANAVELHRWRGTTRGLAAHVRLLTLGDVEIVDSGACTVSTQPTQSVSNSPAHVEVRVAVADPRTIDEPRLLAAIVEAVPAHVTVSLTISVAAGSSGRASARASVAAAPPAAGAKGSASVPAQSPPPDPEGLRTGQLQQPGAGLPVSMAPVVPPVSAPPAASLLPPPTPPSAGQPSTGQPPAGRASAGRASVPPPPPSAAPVAEPPAAPPSAPPGPPATPPRQSGRARVVPRPPDPDATDAAPPADGEGPR